MEYKELKDVCDIIMGQSPDSSSYSVEKIGVPFFQGKAEFGKISPIVRMYCTKPIKISKPLDILMSVRAPVGDVNIANLECCIGRGLCALRVKNMLNYKFIYYYLKTQKENLESKSTGSTFKAINKNILSELIIPIPSFEVQNKTVGILDKAQELIDKRKEQIEALDELVKSKFIEMFGEPVVNTKGWEIKSVIEVCDCMVPGRDKPKSFTGEIPWITIEDLNVNGITFKSKSSLGLTDKEINEVNRKKVPKGSVLMSCVGNLGICSVAGTDMIINQQLHSFQCKTINNIFLMYYLGFRKDYMTSQASSTTVLYMNKSICNSIPVYQPPLELQNKFADFVKQTDKLKFEIKQELSDYLNRAYIEDPFLKMV